MLFLILVAFFINCVLCENCTRHGVSCPDYAVIEEYKDYEDRFYPSLVWVSTSAVGKLRSNVSDELIKRLYGYLGGGNDKGIHLGMMVPVRTAKVPTSESTYNYTMAMALEENYQEDPPRPKDELVTVEREPPRRYVVRSFGGFAREDTEWDSQAQGLKNSTVDDIYVNSSYYFWCVYDSPWQMNNRLNEVWMLKTSDESEESEK